MTHKLSISDLSIGVYNKHILLSFLEEDTMIWIWFIWSFVHL